VNPDAAGTLDRELGTTGPGIFPAGVDILVDCGRLQSGAPGQQGILRTADQVVVVTRPDAAGLAHTLWTLDVVRSLGIRAICTVAIVGSGEFPVRQIEQTLRTKLLEVLPLDQGSAAMACGAPGRSSRFARSSLVAAARRLVDLLLKVPAADPGSFDDDQSDEQMEDPVPLVVELELAGSRDQGRDRR
jgi:MinD-like ATPase involved in chromosome partitioning or flagellar assembly